MIQPVNWKLASHPLNWLTIFLMVVIAGSIGHLLLSYIGIEPMTSKSSYSDAPAGQTPADSSVSAIAPQSA